MSEHDQMHNAENLGPKLTNKDISDDKFSSTNLNIQSIIEQTGNPDDKLVNHTSKKSNLSN
jgi:hypothetical protein